METFIVTSKNGNNYECQFIAEDKIVQVIGPLPSANSSGGRGVAFEMEATCLENARKEIDDAIKRIK